MCYDGCSRGESSKHTRIHLQPCFTSRASSSSSSGGWQDAQFKEAFDLMDRDGDGTIKPSDLMFFLQNSLKSNDLCDKDVESMIMLADRNGSGAVDFQEFLSLLQPRIAPRPPSLEMQALEEIFHVLDRNGDGVLSEDDLRGAVETLGQDLSHEEVLAMLQTATGSDRRHVTFQDFCRFMSTALAQ